MQQHLVKYAGYLTVPVSHAEDKYIIVIAEKNLRDFLLLVYPEILVNIRFVLHFP